MPEKLTLSAVEPSSATLPAFSSVTCQSLAWLRPVKVSVSVLVVLPTRVWMFLKVLPFSVPLNAVSASSSQTLSPLVLLRFKALVPVPPSIMPPVIILPISVMLNTSVLVPPVRFFIPLKTKLSALVFVSLLLASRQEPPPALLISHSKPAKILVLIRV